MPSVAKSVYQTGFCDLLHTLGTVTRAYSVISMNTRGYPFAAVFRASLVPEIRPTRNAVPWSTSVGDDGCLALRTRTTNGYSFTRSALVTQFPVPPAAIIS